MATKTLTPDELLAMPDGDAYELVDGKLVERKSGALSSHVGAQLAWRIANHCEGQKLGWVFGADCGYCCFPGRPALVRRPDVSFIRFGRFDREQLPQGHSPIAPDLAVEVLSPDDLAYETDQKVEEYLAAGVELVWVVRPQSRTVLIYRADGSIQGLRSRDELTGEATLPEFRCRVGDLFPAP